MHFKVAVISLTFHPLHELSPESDDNTAQLSGKSLPDLLLFTERATLVSSIVCRGVTGIVVRALAVMSLRSCLQSTLAIRSLWSGDRGVHGIVALPRVAATSLLGFGAIQRGARVVFPSVRVA